MKIIADPRGKYSYFTWYILGFERLFGNGCVHYDVRPFMGLAYDTRSQQNSGIPIIAYDGYRQLKVFIDTEDRSKVEPDRYEWCDVYGKVNPEFGAKERFPKMLYLGPEFGLRLHNPLWLTVMGTRNYALCRGRMMKNYKAFLSDYLYSYIRRRPIDIYERTTVVVDNYIFHASTLWYNNFAKTDTNYWRGEFLWACQKAGIEIEGGLFYIGESEAVLSEMPDYPKYKETYKDFIYNRRLSMDDYIQKTKESVMVFNTPSVCGCHGWKLAEYLCMGKAIVSTPLSRELPVPLMHGENIHFVKTKQELNEAVLRINTDTAYRHKLERGARAYYEKWVAPEQQARRLIDGVLHA